MNKKFLIRSLIPAGLLILAGFYGLYSVQTVRFSEETQQIETQEEQSQSLDQNPDGAGAEAEMEKVVTGQDESTTAAEEDAAPKLLKGKLNSVRFPAVSEDEILSEENLAQYVIHLLGDMDRDCMDRIYSLYDCDPASLLGQVSYVRLQGRYDPNDLSQDPNNPDTWKIHKFHNIQIDVTDGDSRPIALRSNVKDIIAVSDVYAIQNGIEDLDTFQSHAQELWRKSHSYTVSVGEVYYCSGCIYEKEDRDEPMLFPEEQNLEESLDSGSSRTVDANAEIVLETDGGSESVNEIQTQTEAESVQQAEEEQIMAQVQVEVQDQTATQKQSETQDQTVTQGQSETQDQTAIQERSEAREQTEVQDQMILQGQGNASDQAVLQGSEAAPVQEIFLEQESHPVKDNVQVELSSEIQEITLEEPADRILPNAECPGHVDLNIRMKIVGVNESRGLFDISESLTKGLEDSVNWSRWDEEKKEDVRMLMAQDWKEQYGLELPDLKLRSTLTSAEIDEYMKKLSPDLSDERKKVVMCALSSVGRIPYHYGGKPAGAGYTPNYFGSSTSPDQNGRTRRGLDCSGWVNWVYWTALGSPLTAGGTAELAYAGQNISSSQLKPGDFAVRLGKDSHAVMFLGWMDDGTFLCAHESSYGDGNVMVTTTFDNWAHYVSVLDN